MKWSRRLASACLLAVLLSGCAGEPEAPTGPRRSVDYSDVHDLARQALEPIAAEYIQPGDRILLVSLDQYAGITGRRFVPLDESVKQEEFEKEVRGPVGKAFAGAGLGGKSEEEKHLEAWFTSDKETKQYKLDAGAEGFDQAELGRILGQVGWSSIEPLDLAKYASELPYFVDWFENGLQSAVLAREARGFERLALTPLDAQAAADHRAGRIVFGTSMLDYRTWKDLVEKSQVQKLLVYSIDNVVDSETDYIGFTVGFRLIDLAAGGRILWEGNRTMSSKSFPEERKAELGAISLTLPEELVEDKSQAYARVLTGIGAATPANSVLVKIDDIPVFGTYPPTREDYVVEQTLESFFGSIRGMQVVAKLPKRRYKEPWLLSHAVHYVNPLLGGDYSAFQSYYGARYMIGYRILWKDLQGIQRLRKEPECRLEDRILGIYVKLIDMADNGRVLLSDFLPLADPEFLEQSVLYRCYRKVSGLEKVAAALRDSGVLSDEQDTLLVNRRMEILNGYVGADTLAERFLTGGVAGGELPAVFAAYQGPYGALRRLAKGELLKDRKEGEVADQVEERDLAIAVSLMQSWFEDGLCTLLVQADIPVNEKLESLYSRQLIQKSAAPEGDAEALLYLSPLLLSKWGSMIERYYGIQRIIYFSLLEKGVPAAGALMTDPDLALSRYFPVVSYSPDSLLLSVVGTTSGDYQYSRRFVLE